MFTTHFTYTLVLNDFSKLQDNFYYFVFRLQVIQYLVNTESTIDSLHIDCMYYLYAIPLKNIRISNFQNNNYYNNTSIITKDKLHDLVHRLKLSKTIYVPRIGSLYFYHFKEEELLIYVITKLLLSLAHITITKKILKENPCQYRTR